MSKSFLRCCGKAAIQIGQPWFKHRPHHFFPPYHDHLYRPPPFEREHADPLAKPQVSLIPTSSTLSSASLPHHPTGTHSILLAMSSSPPSKIGSLGTNDKLVKDAKSPAHLASSPICASPLIWRRCWCYAELPMTVDKDEMKQPLTARSASISNSAVIKTHRSH